MTTADSNPVRARLAIEVLLRANGQCELCGKTIADHGIALIVSCRLPGSWGGRMRRKNLWAICADQRCKRALFARFDGAAVRRGMKFGQPIERIGELLKAFRRNPVPRGLLEAVGDGDQWARRLRELRELGWKIESVRDPNRIGRRRYAYRLVTSRPWPPDVAAALKAKRKHARETQTR